jgi:hypothetical protein
MLKKQTLLELQNTIFPKTSSRKNISMKPIEAFVLGQVGYRGQKFVGGKLKGPSRWNNKYKKLFKLLKDLISYYHPDFKYTTIQINKNILSPPHIDKNNVGPSYIIGLGDYQGGDLNIEGKKYNIKNRWKFFDGNKGHWTEPFKGERYSIIYFTHTFKPPHPSKKYLTVDKNGLYHKNELIKNYKTLKSKKSKKKSINFPLKKIEFF